MDVKVEHLEGHIAQLTVTIPTGDTQSAKKQAARRLAKQVRIPGFRPGKAPYNVIEQRLGNDSILEEVVDKAANDYYKKALDDSGIEPAAMGEIKKFEEANQQLVITYEVPKQADVDLKAYREIREDFSVEDVSDEELNEQVEAMIDARAEVEDVEREAQIGDEIEAKLKITWWHDEAHDHDEDDETDEEADAESEDEDHDEHDEHDHDHGHEHVLVDGESEKLIMRGADDERDVLPGFSAQVLGLKAGDEKTFSLDLPEDFEDDTLAGQTVDVQIAVNQVRSRNLPTLDDELVKQIYGEAEDKPQTVDAMRADIKENLQEAKEREAKQAYFDTFFEQVLEAAELTYPAVMVESYLEDRLKQLNQNLQQQANLKLDDYIKVMGLDENQFRAEQREIAAKQLRRELVLLELINAEKLSVSTDDINAEIDRMSAQFGEQAAIYRQMLDTEYGRADVANRLLDQALMDRIVAIGTGNAPDLDADDDTDSEAENVSPDAESASGESDD